MADDDPFSVFSDDDDESSAGDEAEEIPAQTVASATEESSSSTSSRIAKSLMEQVNARLQTNQTKNPSGGIATANEDGRKLSEQQAEAVDLSHLRRLDLDWPPPTYLGPMILVSALAVGGGRGYVASRTLEPGTLVLVEEPVMKWPTEQLGQKLGLVSVEHLLLLEQPSAKGLVQDMEAFHPTKENVGNHHHHHGEEAEQLEQIHKMMQALQSEYEQDEILKIVELAKEKGITSRDGSLLESNDILRLLLALRYNGLESGVYRHVAMLNHDCHPNCTKLFPEGNQSYSEVRTTRRVSAGANLTISYVPRIMSHASRRKYLWEQHRFDIGVQLKGTQLKMELIGNDLPQSHIQKWEEDNIAHRIENATAELEKMLGEMQDDINSGGVAADTLETLKALEQTSLELFTESAQQLKNDNHLLLIPILVVHTETCDQLHNAPELAASIQLGILSRQVFSFHCLIPLQIANLGPDHFDLARTNLDLANAISELLSRSPKKLYELNLSSLTSFEEWSSLEHSSRQEHRRIKTLYPHDAESFIKGVTPV